jgi:predicted RNase H-like HicB family nuclease
MKLNITIELWQKKDWYLAKSPELDIVAQGKTAEEAKSNLFEVINLQFQEMKEMGTLMDYLTECGFEVKDSTISPLNEIIGFEKNTIQIG